MHKVIHKAAENEEKIPAVLGLGKILMQFVKHGC
jgi:hypothetical protein